MFTVTIFDKYEMNRPRSTDFEGVPTARDLHRLRLDACAAWHCMPRELLETISAVERA